MKSLPQLELKRSFLYLQCFISLGLVVKIYFKYIKNIDKASKLLQTGVNFNFLCVSLDFNLLCILLNLIKFFLLVLTDKLVFNSAVKLFYT